MKPNNKTPHKKLRTIILGIVLLVHLISIIYVTFTKDNNNLAGQNTRTSYYEDKYYEEADYNDENYNDEYDNTDEQELDIDSDIVQSIYSYISLYPHIPNFKPNFEVANLTTEEKMKLVAMSLKSKNIITSQPVGEISEQTIVLNNRTYVVSKPSIIYRTYEVISLYSDIFGSSYDFDMSTIMYYDYDIAYKYNSKIGYIEYVAVDQTPINETPNSELVKAIKKGEHIELYINTATATEKYIFERIKDKPSKYQLTAKITEQEKNSL